MKKVILSLLIAFCFLLTVSFLNSTVSAKEQKQAVALVTKLSQEEIKQLQEGAATLGKAFGISPDVKKENKGDKKETENSPAKKTFADVADKSLDMVKNLVISLSETLEKIAPQIWRVMVKQ